MKSISLSLLISCLVISSLISQNGLKINDLEYFEMPGLNVTVFSDIYPEGHQTGVSIIQHGVRVAANGDVRLEISPGQWSPVPKGGEQLVDRERQTITQKLWYPDSSKNQKGFNPIIYPDLILHYQVNVTALSGNSFEVSVDLDEPLPQEWVGRVGFSMELFPGDLFGKSYIMDDNHGIFPIQPNGPINKYYDEYLGDPLAVGRRLVVAPEQDLQRITIETKTEAIELWDGRANHNNSWYIMRSPIPANTTKGVVRWQITPNVIPGWRYKPVVQASQLGYHPEQPKIVLVEHDKLEKQTDEVVLYRLTAGGREEIRRISPTFWGQFLRYNYSAIDFSDVKEPGMYMASSLSGANSSPFKIGPDIYSRHAWQPVMDYYLPVQMCHMRVNEKYRVWHDGCHLDDALMAKTDLNHFDGYKQGPSTLTIFKPLDAVPGLNSGGWHDAGDYDLRVESQMGTVWLLAVMIEEFGLDYDATLVDQENKVVEIHVPDGKSDALQQIEHGLHSVLGGYRSLGRLYRGIICPDLRQYVMLGDGAAMTDNLVYDPSVPEGKVVAGKSSRLDDRMVFTEQNPDRELYVAAGLAASSRVLRASNPVLSAECIETARALWETAQEDARRVSSRVFALSELILTTTDPAYKKALVDLKAEIIEDIARSGWAVGRVISRIEDKKFKRDLSEAVGTYQQELREQATKSPFGVPYEPNIWGAGWTIQRFGVQQYFFYKGWPEHTTSDFFVNALNFVLGVHPGENTSSFASGVGSRSVTVAYGVNRGDWSFIPGGVASGTALIRPDLPELKIWPFFWQQTEYVMGGGSTNYMFLVMAVENLYKQ